jgi:signal recognition particle GTPase
MAGFFKSLISRFSRDAIDWDDLEHSLISGDMGVRLTTEIIDELQGMGRTLDANDVVEVCRKRIMGILPSEVVSMEPLEGRPKWRTICVSKDTQSCLPLPIPFAQQQSSSLTFGLKESAFPS